MDSSRRCRQGLIGLQDRFVAYSQPLEGNHFPCGWKTVIPSAGLHDHSSTFYMLFQHIENILYGYACCILPLRVSIEREAPWTNWLYTTAKATSRKGMPLISRPPNRASISCPLRVNSSRSTSANSRPSSSCGTSEAIHPAGSAPNIRPPREQARWRSPSAMARSSGARSPLRVQKSPASSSSPLTLAATTWPSMGSIPRYVPSTPYGPPRSETTASPGPRASRTGKGTVASWCPLRAANSLNHGDENPRASPVPSLTPPGTGRLSREIQHNPDSMRIGCRRQHPHPGQGTGVQDDEAAQSHTDLPGYHRTLGYEQEEDVAVGL